MSQWPPEVSEALTESGLVLSEAQRNAISGYVDLLQRRGKSLNLLSHGDIERVWERHIFDSLVPVPTLDFAFNSAADLGSGAGLPGIPLAIASPDVIVTLVERTRKRTAFLMQAARDLDLSNVKVLWADAEQMSEGVGPSADVVTVRAVAETALALPLAEHLMRPGGTIVLWQSSAQMERENLPEEWSGVRHDVPSLDGVGRGVRICRKCT